MARNSAVFAANRSADAGRLAHQATIAGIVALVLTPVLLILLGLWLARVVADPLRRTVDAASEVAAGNFDVQARTSVVATSSASSPGRSTR